MALARLCRKLGEVLQVGDGVVDIGRERYVTLPVQMTAHVTNFEVGVKLCEPAAQGGMLHSPQERGVLLDPNG